MFDMAGTGNHTDLMDLTTYGSLQHPKMLEATVHAYSETLGRTGAAGEVRTFMVQQLLEGQAASHAAQGFGIQLPKALVLLACTVHFSDPATQQRLLDRHLRAFPGALWRSDPQKSEVVVLLPAEKMSSSARTSMADDVTRAMIGILDQQVYAVRAHVGNLDDLPIAYEEARTALSVIGAMPDVADRSYSANELLVEVAVARQEPLQSGLMDLLAPLQGGKDLLRTLEALYANNLDREQTARKLYIHRRTLTYRINRIRELSGIDAATPHGMQLLRLALTASNLKR